MQAHVLDADGAGLSQLQRVYVDLLKVGCGGRKDGPCGSPWRVNSGPWRHCPHHQAPSVVLSGAFDVIGASGDRQSLLGADELFDALTQHRPVFLWGGEVPSQIEHGDLTHLPLRPQGSPAWHSLTPDEPVGEISFASGFVVGFCFTDVHAADVT